MAGNLVINLNHTEHKSKTYQIYYRENRKDIELKSHITIDLVMMFSSSCITELYTAPDIFITVLLIR